MAIPISSGDTLYCIRIFLPNGRILDSPSGLVWGYNDGSDEEPVEWSSEFKLGCQEGGDPHIPLEFLTDYEAFPIYSAPDGCPDIMDIGGTYIWARYGGYTANILLADLETEPKFGEAKVYLETIYFEEDSPTPDPPAPVEEKIYRINVKRSDTHAMIGNENIWVGNTPNDGFSKQTSGQTMGEEYSYVEFTWNELLKAIGEEPVVVIPTITVEANNTVIPKSGGTINVTITVTDGVYSGYEITSDRPTITVTTISPSEVIATLVFPPNDTNDEIRYTFVGHGRGVGDSSSYTCSDSIQLLQTYDRWVLSDVDYVIFTYEWTGANGRDLDSFTFIDGLATGRTSWCGEYFESGVGYRNGKDYNPGGTVKGETFVGSSYNDSVIKFAGDNTDSGGEYTLIDFKKLNEYVEEGLNNGQLQPDGKIVIYLMGCWYITRSDGFASASFTAYKGGTVYREILEETQFSGKYKYSVSGDTEIKGTKEVTGINVFSARFNSLDNSQEALKTYTTMAAFVYDYSTNTFFLETEQERILAINPNRYNYGLQLKYDGYIQINGSSVIQKSFSDNLTIKINIGDIQSERAYYFDFSQACLTSTSGSTPNSPVVCYIRFDSCETVDPSSQYYDGTIELQYINDHSYKITVPAGHIYSGSYTYGYSAYYHLTQTDEFLDLVSKHVGKVGYLKTDLNEIQT